MGGYQDPLSFPRLRAGVPAPAPDTLATGRLVRDGNLLRMEINGVVVWPRSGEARATPGNGNIIIVWPRGATLQRSGGGGGSTVIVWPRTVGAGTPIRVGEEVELVGNIITTDDIAGRSARADIITVDNVSGRIAGCPRLGCAGPLFIVSEFRPRPTR